MKSRFLVIFFLFLMKLIYGQFIVQGIIIDQNNKPLANVTIFIDSLQVISDHNGRFNFQVNKKTVKLKFRLIGYKTIDTVLILPIDREVKIIMQKESVEIEEVIKYGQIDYQSGVLSINTKNLTVLPSITDNAIEQLIMTSMGVQTYNELSSQYSVRGGNFDENLVYIEGFKVYRPVLLTGGQKEALSIINSDLVKEVKFWAGGFPANFGDKMSSVLKINYLKPKDKILKLNLGLTALNLTYGNNWRKTSYITGLRFKQNTYILNALPIKGNYKPIFFDFQTFITHKFSNSLTTKILIYTTDNQYNFYPDSLNVAVNVLTTTFKLPIKFYGQEKDRYNAKLLGLAFNFRPKPNIVINLNSSIYKAKEAEKYTIEAFYRLDMLTRLLSENQNDSSINIALGRYLEYARNIVDYKVFRLNLDCKWQKNTNIFNFGFEYQQSKFLEQLISWKFVDSAGYSYSLNPSYANLNLFDFVYGQNNYLSSRIIGYFNWDKQYFFSGTKVKHNFGLRFIHWIFGQEISIDPRLSISFYPNWLNDWEFRIAAGKYSQVPFFYELVDKQGDIHTVKILKSLHFVVGAYKDFKFMDRPFKFSTEAYLKWMWDLVPYDYYNFRVQYYPELQSIGYAVGWDFRLYGQFVPEVDSWVTVSLLQTKEKILDDSSGFIPRPTNQFLTISMFFQDYMPQNRNMRVSLGLFYGSGRPVFVPASSKSYMYFYAPFYLRADIGFIYLVNPKKFARQIMFELDLLNAFDVMNVAGYQWILLIVNSALVDNPLVENNSFFMSVPNYLTPRIINFKVKIKF